MSGHEVVRGDIWRHKKTGREAVVIGVYRQDISPQPMSYRYRTPNPQSRASKMTCTRRNEQPTNVRRFREMFEPTGKSALRKVESP